MKSVLVTGCNRGIGFGLVKYLTQQPISPQYLFATCRNPVKAEVCFIHITSLLTRKDRRHVVDHCTQTKLTVQCSLNRNIITVTRLSVVLTQQTIALRDCVGMRVDTTPKDRKFGGGGSKICCSAFMGTIYLAGRLKIKNVISFCANTTF
jgi:hypothetical protein